MDDRSARMEQLKNAAQGYFDGLKEKSFERIPYADDIILRAPLAPGGVNNPLSGKDNLEKTWWAPLPGVLGDVRLKDIYYNEGLSAVVGEAEVEINIDPPTLLRVADRFTVNAQGEITEQVNHFDPRDVTHPGWQNQA